MTALRLPASTIARSVACSAGASGVVACSTLSSCASPIRVATVLTRPGARPAASSAATARNAVVVLPSVPVMPSTPRSWLGSPYHQVAAVASAGCVAATTSWATSRSRGRSSRSADAPARTAVSAKSCPSTCAPGIATNRPPGITRRESWVTPRIGSPASAAVPIALPPSRAPRSLPCAVSRSTSPPSGRAAFGSAAAKRAAMPDGWAVKWADRAQPAPRRPCRRRTSRSRKRKAPSKASRPSGLRTRSQAPTQATSRPPQPALNAATDGLGRPHRS